MVVSVLGFRLRRGLRAGQRRQTFLRRQVCERGRTRPPRCRMILAPMTATHSGSNLLPALCQTDAVACSCCFIAMLQTDIITVMVVMCVLTKAPPAFRRPRHCRERYRRACEMRLQTTQRNHLPDRRYPKRQELPHWRLQCRRQSYAHTRLRQHNQQRANSTRRWRVDEGGVEKVRIWTKRVKPNGTLGRGALLVSLGVDCNGLHPTVTYLDWMRKARKACRRAVQAM